MYLKHNENIRLDFVTTRNVYNVYIYIIVELTHWIMGNIGNQQAIRMIYTGTHITFATTLSGICIVRDGMTSKPKLRCVKDGVR